MYEEQRLTESKHREGSPGMLTNLSLLLKNAQIACRAPTSLLSSPTLHLWLWLVLFTAAPSTPALWALLLYVDSLVDAIILLAMWLGKG